MSIVYAPKECLDKRGPADACNWRSYLVLLVIIVMVLTSLGFSTLLFTSTSLGFPAASDSPRVACEYRSS